MLVVIHKLSFCNNNIFSQLFGYSGPSQRPEKGRDFEGGRGEWRKGGRGEWMEGDLGDSEWRKGGREGVKRTDYTT